MKKKAISKILVTMMAITMMSGSTLCVHAEGTDDGVYHGDGGVSYGGTEGESGGFDTPSDSGSSDSGSSGGGSSEPSYSAPSESSSHSGRNDSQDYGASYSAPSDGGSASSSASVSTPSVTKAAGDTTGVTGGETFRALAKSGAGTYKVTHKGNVIATFSLKDANGNAAISDAVYLKQRSDGKWAIEYDVKDSTGLTVGAPLDRTYMYDTLGVSYVTINDEIVIDIEAESAAAKAAK